MGPRLRPHCGRNSIGHSISSSSAFPSRINGSIRSPQPPVGGGAQRKSTADGEAKAVLERMGGAGVEREARNGVPPEGIPSSFPQDAAGELFGEGAGGAAGSFGHGFLGGRGLGVGLLASDGRQHVLEHPWRRTMNILFGSLSGKRYNCIK